MLLGDRLHGELLFAVLTAACLLMCAAGARADVAQPQPTKPQAGASPQAAAAPQVMVPRSTRGEMWVAARYGVDHLQVHYTASGSSLVFRYHVVDADKAMLLSDKHATPYLIDQKSGIKLLVPVMDQIGALRETTPPEQGHEYFLVFGNAGKIVKPGQRVDVSIGAFHVYGLTVE
jgi:hypothetical protein